MTKKRAAAPKGRPKVSQAREVATGVDEAGGGDEDEAVEALRGAEHGLRCDQASHRVADQGRAAVDPELLAEVEQETTVSVHLDRPRGHWAGSEAGQVESDRAVGATEMGEVLQPGLPGARDPVDEDDRLPLADLGVVDRCPGQLDPVDMGTPVDLQPLPV